MRTASSFARTTKRPTKIRSRRSPERGRPTRKSPSPWFRCSKPSAGPKWPSSTRIPTTRNTPRSVAPTETCHAHFIDSIDPLIDPADGADRFLVDRLTDRQDHHLNFGRREHPSQVPSHVDRHVPPRMVHQPVRGHGRRHLSGHSKYEREQTLAAASDSG